jgi:pimeloyl-ACP methyl ester carboxylesterase
VLGLSWGSTLALELYRRRPDIPRTLILASAYAGWAGSLSPDEVAERRARALHDLDGATDELVRRWLPTLLTERAPQGVIDELSAIMSDFHPAGARAMLDSMVESNLGEVLPAIDVPTLLLCGEEDQRSPLSVAREMQAGISGSSLVVLPGAGHQSNMEAPDLFNDAVRSFLRSN